MEPQSTSQEKPTQPADSETAYLHVESRPASLIAADYVELPFPNIGPIQEVAFDLGITSVNGEVELTGAVIKGYHEHQLLFEQRWPARIIQRRIGEADLLIPPGTGIAIRSLQFMLHAYELLSMVEVTVVGRQTANDQRTEATLQIPVRHHRQQTDLHFPLRGTWWAIQAADWSDHHKQEVFSQTYAVDFVKLGPDNQTFRGSGARLEDHYSWDQPIYAAAGGKVAYVCYDMPDMPPAQMPDPAMLRDDMRRILGNAIAISHANGEFSYYAHLQQASLQVNQGDLIRRGMQLAKVGNSGHSPGPHLHFHLMEGPNLFIDQGLPVQFSHFWSAGQFFDRPTTIPTRLIVSDAAPTPPSDPTRGPTQ